MHYKITENKIHFSIINITEQEQCKINLEHDKQILTRKDIKNNNITIFNLNICKIKICNKYGKYCSLPY